MGKYDQPSKINFVSITVFLILAGSIYAGVQFAPVYYRQYQTKGVLSDAGNKLYPRRASLETEDGMAFVNEVEQATVKRLHELGIVDTALYVKIQKVGDRAVVTANYQEVIRHPLVNKPTIMRLAPTVEVSLAQAEY